jgi:hypothetical protein
MPCYTRLKPRQTIQQRAEEVRKAVAKLAAGLVNGKVVAKVGPQGAITFVGLTVEDRDGVTDACIYRQLMVSGNALALAKIAQAERLAGRSVNKQVVGSGVHSHDGGVTWHGKG